MAIKRTYESCFIAELISVVFCILFVFRYIYIYIYIVGFHHKQCASDQKGFSFEKFISQMFSSTNESIKGETSATALTYLLIDIYLYIYINMYIYMRYYMLNIYIQTYIYMYIYIYHIHVFIDFIYIPIQIDFFILGNHSKQRAIVQAFRECSSSVHFDLYYLHNILYIHINLQ